MYVWLDLIQELMTLGYKVKGKDKCLKHIEYPNCEIEGEIISNVTPLLTVYELINLIEKLGNNKTIEKSNCIVNTCNKNHIEWLEQIGGYKIPSDTDIEVNILPIENKLFELSVDIVKGNIKCNLNILPNNTYSGFISVNDENNLFPQVVIIWECEFDSVLNNNICTLIKKYSSITVIKTIGVLTTERDINLEVNTQFTLKVTILDYASKTLSIRKDLLGEKDFNQILLSDLPNYFINL